MFKTISRFTSSFAALLSDQNTIFDLDNRQEDIRDAMIAVLNGIDSDDCKRTWIGIQRATDVQTLWYLRSDMLRLLGEQGGEQQARRQMDALTEMFRGVVPDNQMPVERRFKG
jgi:hypothetical protein